jgi:hypothetical protein
MGKITAIEDLAEVLEVESSDAFPLHSAEAGAARKVALSVLTEYLLEQMEPLSGLERQAAAPSASPFTTTVAPSEDGVSVRLILKPPGTMAVGTIALPADGEAEDGQEVLVNCTQIVTALTVSATGLNVTGAPTTLAANAFFRMMYDAVDETWYRVG